METPRWIIGCGYVGQRLAAAELAAGRRVAACVTSHDKARQLIGQGLDCHRLNLDTAEHAPDFDCLDAVVHYHVPPTPEGEQDQRMRTFLRLLERAGRPQRLVYLSTTGVYGDTGGAWVDENSPVNPQTSRARRRLDAEQQLTAWCRHHGSRLVILRVPGIYGPGRTALARLGNPVIQPHEAPYSNRIHVDDLVSACQRAADSSDPLPLYNVSDDQPSTMTDYFYATADHAGIARPTAISMAQAKTRLSAAMLSYLGESRRVDNRRMREHLGVVLRFPNLASGLADCFGKAS